MKPYQPDLRPRVGAKGTFFGISCYAIYGLKRWSCQVCLQSLYAPLLKFGQFPLNAFLNWFDIPHGKWYTAI